MKVLITGGHGATGSYLAEYIRAEHPEVELLAPSREEMDVNHAFQIADVLKQFKPDRIFHLAAKTRVQESFIVPAYYFVVNAVGTLNLLDRVRQICPNSRVLFCSTCEVYGHPTTKLMDEFHPIEPVNPYGASKAAADLLATTYAKSYRLHVVVSRLFNLINPRASHLFSSQFARRIAEIEAKKSSHFVHGNLDSARTLLDVRDVVRGYWMLLDKGMPGEAYNIGDEREVTLREFLDRLTSQSTAAPIRRVKDDELVRPVDIRSQVADSRKFRSATGWEPRYTLDESVAWLLETKRREANVA